MASPLELPSCSHDEILIGCFREGFQYKEILSLLLNCHNISIKMKTFQRTLKRLKIKHNNVKTCSTGKASAVLTELKGSGLLLGYRSVHQRLRSRGIVTDRESVRICMKVLDPAGVSLRKQHKLVRRSYYNKGPNYLWHIDGNDKLKPFGLCIHGAIDGFSRKVLWLIGVSKIVLLLVSRRISIVKGIKIIVSVSYLED